MTLGRVGDYKPDEQKLADAVPFTAVYGKLVVGAEINKAKKKSSLSLMLDTGSDDEMMVPMKVAQELELFDLSAPPTNRRWITGVGGSYVGSPFVGQRGEDRAAAVHEGQRPHRPRQYLRRTWQQADAAVQDDLDFAHQTAGV